MKHGPAQGIREMYLNVIRSSDTLDQQFQRRAHHVAKLAKDEDLASALARRPDTLSEIDDDLATWGSAKVQSAWFTRPGRDLAKAAQRLSREKRVTVLEVIAGLPDLDERFYAICAKRDASRVALPLMSNESAPVEYRTAAAATIAREFEGLSYAKKGALVAILASCDPRVADMFVCATSDLSVANRAMGNVSYLSIAATEHVYDMCHKRLVGLKSTYIDNLARSKNQTRGSWYGSSHYEITQVLRELIEAFRHVTLLSEHVSADKSALTAALDDLDEIFAKGEWGSNDVDFAKAISDIRPLLDASAGPVRTNSPANACKAAATAEEILEIIKPLTNSRSLDRGTAFAALLHPKATLEVAECAVKAFGWGETTRLLEAKHRDLNFAVRTYLVIASCNLSDKQIERFANENSPKDLWMEIVAYYAKNNRNIPNDLLQSRFAQAEIIPKLPLRAFSQGDLPGWMVTAFSQFLATELTTQAAWDGFEVLAPTHLGTVAQVVRAAKLTTRSTGTDGSTATDEA